MRIKNRIKESSSKNMVRGGPRQLSLEVVQADGNHQGSGQIILQTVKIGLE
jgi:hypothetical protein